MDRFHAELSKLFALKGLGGSCSIAPVPGGALTMSEVPHRTITPLRFLLVSFGLDVDS